MPVPVQLRDDRLGEILRGRNPEGSPLVGERHIRQSGSADGLGDDVAVGEQSLAVARGGAGQAGDREGLDTASQARGVALIGAWGGMGRTLLAAASYKSVGPAGLNGRFT